MNELHNLLFSAYLAFEPEDVDLIEQAETTMMERIGPDELRRLGPATCVALLAIGSLWFSLPANSSIEDYTVNYHALNLASHQIVRSAYRPRPEFPFTQEELYNALQKRRRQAYKGDNSPLVESLRAAIDAIAQLNASKSDQESTNL